MQFTASKTAAARYGVLLCAVLPVIARAENIRIVDYNTQGDVSSPTPTGVLPYIDTVLEGIGQEKYTGDNIQQLPDVIALQETASNSASVVPIVTALNKYYGNSNYSYSTYQATQSGSNTDGNGPNALIYNQATLNLNSSTGVGTPEGATNGEYRQVVRYQFQPLADKGTSNGFFYVYDCHAKSLSSGTISTDQMYQEEEAAIIRANEATLPANAAVVYVGDFNVNASTDPSLVEMFSAGQGQAFDPLNPTNQSQDWADNAAYKSILTDSDTSLKYRDDLQLLTSNVLNGTSGTLNYVANSEHAFGNNGTTSVGTTTNSSSNTALNDITGNGALSASQVLTAENGSLGSDHLPVVADYFIAVVTQPNGIWNGGTANWSNSAFWSNGVVPNSSTLEVKIDNGNAIVSVVTLDISVSVSDIVLDANNTLNISSGQSLTLAGPATTMFNGTVSNSGTISAASINVSSGAAFTLTPSGMLIASGTFTNLGATMFTGSQNWSGGAVFNNAGGTAVFDTDAGTFSSNLQINLLAGTLTLGSIQHLAALNISSGTTATVIGGGNGRRSIVITPVLTIAGTLDLTDNDLDVQNGNLQTISTLVTQGYNGGTWTGTGITSSTAALDSTHLTTLGVMQNNQSGTALFTAAHPFNGTAPGAGDVLVAYTYYGDANLDGMIDGSDYSLIDNGYLNQLTGWFNGDFNYDGVINGSDYALIDNSFNQQGVQLDAAVATGEIAGSTAVPEPVTLGFLSAGCLGLLSRRRRT